MRARTPAKYFLKAGVGSIRHRSERAATVGMPRLHSLSQGLMQLGSSSGQRPGIVYYVLIGVDNELVCVVLRLCGR